MLTPESDPKTTILIPVENATEFGLRAIISSAEADEIINYFADVTVTWDRNLLQRKKANLTAARGLDLMELAKLIKVLLVQRTTTALCISDKAMLLASQNRLFSEIAMAKGLQFTDVMQMACGAYKRDIS